MKTQTEKFSEKDQQKLLQDSPTKKMSDTERKFFERIERLKSFPNLKVSISTAPASRFFGEKITVSIFANLSTAAWTLRKPGKLHPRTSVRTFGMINGKRTTVQAAYRRITGI